MGNAEPTRSTLSAVQTVFAAVQCAKLKETISPIILKTVLAYYDRRGVARRFWKYAAGLISKLALGMNSLPLVPGAFIILPDLAPQQHKHLKTLFIALINIMKNPFMRLKQPTKTQVKHLKMAGKQQHIKQSNSTVPAAIISQ